jgi:hypothetical protein
MLAVVCALMTAPAFAEQGPLSALAVIQEGVDKADSDLFEQGADLNSLLRAASETLIASLKQQAAEGKLGDANMALGLAIASMDGDSSQAVFIRQLLLSEVRGFVISGINGGYFAGQPNGSIKPSRASLASTLPKMPQGRREIIPGAITSQEGDKATATATFVDPGAGRLPLELALKRENGRWRVTEVLNAAELLNRTRGKAGRENRL